MSTSRKVSPGMSWWQRPAAAPPPHHAGRVGDCRHKLLTKFVHRFQRLGEYHPAHRTAPYLCPDVEVHDREQGIRWLKQAAERGHEYAAYRLAKELLKDGLCPQK